MIDPFAGPERERVGLNPGGQALAQPVATHCGGTPWGPGQKRCNTCGLSAPPVASEAALCPKCGTNVVMPNALRCSSCAATAPQGGFGPYTAPQPPIEYGGLTRRRLQKEGAALRKQFDRAAAELPSLLARVTATVESLRAIATTIANVEGPLSGRAMESVRDELLHSIRARVADAARALQGLRI